MLRSLVRFDCGCSKGPCVGSLQKLVHEDETVYLPVHLRHLKVAQNIENRSLFASSGHRQSGALGSKGFNVDSTLRWDQRNDYNAIAAGPIAGAA